MTPRRKRRTGTTTMKRVLPFFACVFVFALCIDLVHGQPTRSPQIVQLFRPVVAKSAKSTVRVLVGDKEAALGVVVATDGWILTKHSELKGQKITVKLADGKTLDAELFGSDERHDLAMLKVDADDLTPIEWADSKIAKAGHWVASAGTGQDPVAIGIISVPTREVKGAKFIPPSGGGSGGYLGLKLDLDYAGVKVEDIVKDTPPTPAQKAGLKPGDLILAINGQAVMNIDEFTALLSRHK